MSDISAKISQSGLLKGSSSSQQEVVASKVEVNTAGINLGDLSDVVITSPTDGSYVIYQSSSNTFLDDQTIVKTGTGINLTGTLEADAITVNGITLAETISDTVGNMIDSNTESGIAVTYDDSDNTLDFNVDDFSITLTGDVTGSGTVTNLGNVSFETTIQPNSVALGTDTTGDYVGTITGGTGIDSNAATSGEGTTHTLSVDLNELSTETSIAQADFITMVDATDDGSGKITFSNLEDTIFSNVSGDIAIAAGGAATIQATSVENSMLAGSISNDKLAGSITNAKLANSSVSFGGVSVALGASNSTPAFDLQDATGYLTSSLVGTITDAQLAGSITTAKLAGSITNDKLSNSSITVSDGTNTSPVALGGTLTFAGTSNEVTVVENAGTVTVGLPDDVTIAGDLSVATAPTSDAHVTNKTYVDAKVAALVDSAPAALDTLNELAAALGDDASYATTTATSLGNRLRIDVNNQSLTADQKSNAITNLGLGTAATTPIGNYATAAQGTKADNALVASTVSAYGATIIDDADAGAARTTLGLGNVQNKSSATIIGEIVDADIPSNIARDSELTSFITASSSDTLTNKSIVATQLTGTIDNGRLPAAATTITSVGTLTALTVDNIAIDGTTIGHTSDTDILTFSASEPKLTVSAAAMEIVDASDTATAGPTLSLYKNRANPANGDQLGRILFVGENDDNEKAYYGQITCEIGGAGVDGGGEQAEFKFLVTDGTPNGTDNLANDLTEDYTTIGPSDQTVLKINSAGCTVNGADGLTLGAGKNIVFTGANNYYGDGAYQNYLRQEEPSQASVNANDNHSYQMLPTGSGVIMRSRGSDRVLDNNIDISTEVITFGSAHGLRTGDPVVYNDAKGTPIQINDGSNKAVDSARFFAIVTSTTAIKLATTVANALAGTALNIVNDGADNQSFLFPNQMDNPIQMRDQVFELGHKTTTERDALTAETAFNGAILYNDTTNQVNAYVNNAWKAVATTNAESFTGGMTVTGGLQASPKTIFYDSTSTLTIVPATHAGTKIVNGIPAGAGAGPCTYNFPVPAAANIGETYTIVNFGVANITLTCSAGGGNDFRALVLGTGAANKTTIVIPGGAAVEVITTNYVFSGQLQYVVFGSGVI